MQLGMFQIFTVPPQEPVASRPPSDVNAQSLSGLCVGMCHVHLSASQHSGVLGRELLIYACVSLTAVVFDHRRV